MPTDPRSADCRRVDALRCTDLTVEYAGTAALSHVDLTVAAGETVALLGASGSGKSTLLNAVAGLLTPARGEIWIGGEQVATHRRTVPPEHRQVAMVFQNFALWPHLTVLHTVAYPLRRAGRSRHTAASTAIDLLAQLGIDHLAARRPAELSGGEQQRVGLARALARNAALYLLDEPTAHLDTHLRAAFQSSVLDRQRATGAAVVYATHDCAEALGLADRVAILAGGRLIQIGSPVTVYTQPSSVAAAALTGACSVLTVPVSDADAAPDGDERCLLVDLGDGPVAVLGGGAGISRRPARRQILIRPDWVRTGGRLPARVTAVGFRGAHTEYHLDTAVGPILLHLPGSPRHAAGDPLRWTLQRTWVLGAPNQPVPNWISRER